MNASLTFIMKILLWHANAIVVNQELALELCNIVLIHVIQACRNKMEEIYLVKDFRLQTETLRLRNPFYSSYFPLTVHE